MPDHLTSLTQHQRDHLIHHTHCGMLAFTDDLLKAVLEGDPAAEKLLGQATGRAFTTCESTTRAQFQAFRGAIELLDVQRDEKNIECSE